MGKKGPTRHLKRHQSPAFWPIHRKGGTWSLRTQTGPHSLNTSIPTSIILRDELKYAKTAREAKSIIKNSNFIVNGKPRIDEKYPVGLMDIISIPATKEHFRVLPDHGGKLKLLPIEADEAKYKLVRIIGKTTQRDSKTQLNFHDGTNINIKTESDNYKVNDVLKISVSAKEIMNHIEFKEMQKSIITGGRSQGTQGTIISFGSEPGWKKTATVRTNDGNEIRTLAQYLFVVGENEPIIKLSAGEE